MADASHKPGLRRDLGFLQATSLAITDMVGIGPFITIPLFLATMGGPQAMLGWLVGAALAFCDGLVWAELGAALPKAGVSYYYLREAFGPTGAGRWISFLVVWQIMFSAPLSVASGSIGFANYSHYLVPGMTPWEVRLLASTIPLFLIMLLYRRVRAVGNLSVVMMGGVLVGCFWIIASGLPHVSASRIFDFPPHAFHLNVLFWAGLGHATLYALYDYFGYYNVCYLAEEIRDPGRVIPLSILFSIGAVAVVYILMNTSILSVIPWREAQHSQFIASEYIQKLQGRFAGDLMTLLMLWIAFASAFSLLLGYSRIPYAAAADGNFFKVFARLHPKHDIPHVSLVTLGVIAAGFSLLRLPEVIVSLVATRVLLQYLPQAVGFFVLRFKQPHMMRPFKMWFYPIPGIISLLGWIYILATSAHGALVFALVIFALGTAAYMARARKRGEWPFVAREAARQIGM